MGATKVTPVEVTTDKAPVYPAVLDELLPMAWHRSEQYANHRVECDHGRLKSRLRPMRGLKQDGVDPVWWTPKMRAWSSRWESDATTTPVLPAGVQG